MVVSTDNIFASPEVQNDGNADVLVLMYNPHEAYIDIESIGKSKNIYTRVSFRYDIATKGLKYPYIHTYNTVFLSSTVYVEYTGTAYMNVLTYDTESSVLDFSYEYVRYTHKELTNNPGTIIRQKSLNNVQCRALFAQFDLFCTVYLNLTSLSDFGFDSCTNVANLVSVLVDGQQLTTSVEPRTVHGRTLVPMRQIFEKLGATVSWDDATQTITAVKGPTIIQMTVGQTAMYVNGQVYYLEAAPLIINNTTLVPVRAIANALGVNIQWDDTFRTVLIYDKTACEYVKLYDTDLVLHDVDKNLRSKYMELGWAETPEAVRVTLYSLDGRTQKVPYSQVAANLNVGWYPEEMTTVYARDGRTQLIPSRVTVQYVAAGWSQLPGIIMYSADLRKQLVPFSAIEANKTVGWYEMPVVPMYAGSKTQIVELHQVEANEKVGWSLWK